MKWGKNLNEPYIEPKDLDGQNAKVHIKTYGCQMNVNDTEIASAILSQSGYQMMPNIEDADIVFLMTCAIRENAENKVWHKLRELERAKRSGAVKKFGLLGCMAERLKTKVLEEVPTIDVIGGPDSYRHLPKLLAVNSLTGQNAVNVLLSLDETYDDVLTDVHPHSSTITSRTSAYVSITRGCNNLCSYCIVPHTRGRERSRSIETILKEVRHYVDAGVREIILLGQNVNSYRDFGGDQQVEGKEQQQQVKLAAGFRTLYKLKSGGIGFDVLLDEVARAHPDVRIRFTSPHPKDFTDEVIEVIARHPNIAKGLHMPAQSGSDAVLERMRRGYTKAAYLSLVERIRAAIPGCAINSDFICGFCGETDADHQETLDLVERVGYLVAYIFAYSMRERTHAHYHLVDDVPQEVKIARLTELNQLYRLSSLRMNQATVGTRQLLLIEGVSKKSPDQLYGRNEANQKVVLTRRATEDDSGDDLIDVGDFVDARIVGCTSVTLLGEPVAKSSITAFYA